MKVPQNNNPSSLRLIATVFSLGMTFGSGMGYGFWKNISGCSQPLVQNFSLTEYVRLELGMSLTDSEAFLGRGIETRRTPVTVTVMWVNSNGSSITASFENGKLIAKQQSGLK